jgi:hypothetical protein
MSSSSIVQQPHEGFAAGKDSFLTPLQQQQLATYRRLEAEAKRRGWTPASLISLHPFSWPVTGPVHQVDIRIPAVALDKDVWLAAPKLRLRSGLEIPYAHYVFTQWKPMQMKYLQGQLDFEEVNDSGHIWPIEQAEDAIKQNDLGANRGGVFAYEGTHLPLSLREKYTEELDKLEASHAVQMNYYQQWYEKAQDAYMGRNTTNSWKDLIGKGKYHRWIATYFLRIGKIRELPAWCEEMSSPGNQAHKCDQCQQNVERDAPICRHCNRVLKPYEAFSRLMIDADTPGAKLCAKRLKPEELQSLIDDHRLSAGDLAKWEMEVPREASKNAAAAKKEKEKAAAANASSANS